MSPLGWEEERTLGPFPSRKGQDRREQHGPKPHPTAPVRQAPVAQHGGQLVTQGTHCAWKRKTLQSAVLR